MALQNIRKRDGRTEPFDVANISNAIRGSMRELEREDAERAGRLARQAARLLDEGDADAMPTVEQIQDMVERVLVQDGDPDLAKAYILHRFRHAGLREAKSLFGVHDDLKLSLNAIRVLEKRYLRKNAAGDVVETPAQMFRRVADAIAAPDAQYDGVDTVKKSADTFYRLMASLEFLPNSPTLMNAGSDLGQLSACFVLPIEDSMDGIFSALRDMAFIHQSGGGTGFSFSDLRPRREELVTLLRPPVDGAVRPHDQFGMGLPLGVVIVQIFADGLAKFHSHIEGSAFGIERDPIAVVVVASGTEIDRAVRPHGECRIAGAVG